MCYSYVILINGFLSMELGIMKYFNIEFDEN